MIIIKSQEEVEKIARACKIVAQILRDLRDLIEPGIATKDIERFVDKTIAEKGAVAAFRGYRNYPSSVCTSVNDQVVHGIPSNLRLKEGDILSVDLGIYLDGFYGDGAISIPVGKISSSAQRLLRITEEALYIGIEKAKPGNRVSDISSAIQRYVESHGYSVVRTFVGHGIGRSLHEEPQVPNYGSPGQGPRLKEGMTLAIEPMVNEGTHEVRILEDGWTAVTADGKLSAHFEHTIAITKNGARILTKID